MPRFMLLLHDDASTFAGLSPGEIQEIIEEYTAWRADLEERGLYAGGNKLTEDAGRHLTAENGDVRVLDGPWSETKELLGGYFIIEASDYDGAVDVARECPGLRHGTRIELRQVDAIHD